jgi:chromatin segregation and condensation protein Rec8/ScpA/Scc1 (kleisin family)
MAILELVRRRRADAQQEVPFGDIVVVIANDQPLNEQAPDQAPAEGEPSSVERTEETAADD